MGRFDEVYRSAMANPEGFWSEAAKGIHWIETWDKVLDASNPPLYRWFTGGVLNTCYNALDRHIEDGRGDTLALIYDSPVTSTVRRYTYTELRDAVARFAGVLAGLGVVKGDRVILYMPMVPEAAIAMLACARIGAIHSVVFGGFAANELATRINDATPKVIVSASCGVEPGRVVPYKPLLDAAIVMATWKPEKCVILQRLMEPCALVRDRDVDWAEAVAAATPADCVPVKATDPLYILYNLGHDGQPKGVVRDNGGHAVALKWSMKHVYDVDPGDVFWAASDVGWVVGHSYIVYAPLLQGCTTILYEGKPVGTPDAGAFWRVISQHKVSTLFTAPTAFRAIKRDDPDGKLIRDYDLSNFRILFLAGERSDPATLEWAEAQLKVPVIDHWWQTESGWPMAANCMGIEPLKVKHGSPTRAVPGWDVRVVDSDGREVKRGEIGAIVCKLPMPPGAFPTLWNAEQRYRDSYLREYPGFYQTGDAGFMDDDDYVYIMSRTDDIINVAGHRLSTGGMEEVLAAHPDVAECAVIGAADQLKGQVPLGFLVLKAGVIRPHAEIVKEVVQMVRDRIGPVAAFKTATVVKRLPKTRSGKILRGTMQKIADGQDYKAPATIDDPAILPEIAEALSDVGYAKRAMNGMRNALKRLRMVGMPLAAVGLLNLLMPGYDPIALAEVQASPADDLAMHARAEPYIAFADQILAAVTTGQSGALRASLSPATLSAWSAEDVDLFVDKIVMPFFADYAAPVAEQWIAPTTHPAGFTGFAFYRSFTTTNGRTKPYVLYVLEEEGRMVVGNLLVGKTFKEMHPQP